MIALLAGSQGLFLFCIGIFGLIVGSFLNVVILRLPLMLQHEWITQCYAYLQEHEKLAMVVPPQDPLRVKPFNLNSPGSHCPHCQHPIQALDNIPLISFLLLRGKCRHCQTAISWRYPLIELLTAFFSIITAFHFGFAGATAAALALTFALIALTGIDYDHHLLPDDITISFLWLGLGLNIFATFTDLKGAVIGAIVGYLCLWTVYWLFKLITGKEGMGYGDFKLLAMLGAWLGWQALPIIVLVSSILGATVGLCLILFKRHSREQPLPFGPYLALAGWISLLWGDKILHGYFKFSGIS